MKNKNYNTLTITTFICLLPITLALILYDQLPKEIAIHFDNSGNPDNYLPKLLVVIGLPLFFILINLYTHFRLNNDPKNENMSYTLKQIIKWVVPITSVILIPLTLFSAIGKDLPINMIVTAIVGVIIVCCGNYLPKCKRNYTMGIKLPWTLDSEDNWNKTHHFAGFVWVIGGIIFTINAFFLEEYLMIGIITIIVILPAIYSYLIYKKH